MIIQTHIYIHLLLSDADGTVGKSVIYRIKFTKKKKKGKKRKNKEKT